MSSADIQLESWNVEYKLSLAFELFNDVCLLLWLIRPFCCWIKSFYFLTLEGVDDINFSFWIYVLRHSKANTLNVERKLNLISFFYSNRNYILINQMISIAQYTELRAWWKLLELYNLILTKWTTYMSKKDRKLTNLQIGAKFCQCKDWKT